MKIEIDIDSKVLGVCHECIEKKDFTLVGLSIKPTKWSVGNEEQVVKLLSKILNVEYIKNGELILTLTIDGTKMDSFDTSFLLSLI